MAMRALLTPLLLGLFFLPGCLPLFMAGARVAVSTVSWVASEARAPSAPAEPELPQDQAALLELYQGCLRQRATTPGLDCGRYRAAVVQATARPEPGAESEAGRP